MHEDMDDLLSYCIFFEQNLQIAICKYKIELNRRMREYEIGLISNRDLFERTLNIKRMLFARLERILEEFYI